MGWPDLELLEEIGLTLYERKALATLMIQGMADAETLCREGEIPSSKIYQAMEKLAGMGLAEIQPTRPKLYSALPGDEVVNRVVEISRHRAEQFSKQAEKLKVTLSAHRDRVRGRKAFVDLALGVESHVKRHMSHLTTARKRIWSYLEQGDLAAMESLAALGFPILRRIAQNTTEHKIDHRVVFGFTYQTAPQLVSFLRKHKAHMEQVTGVRYSGEFGHPFHVIDDDLVILSLDHPFIPEGRFASLLVRDQELAQKLAEGFGKPVVQSYAEPSRDRFPSSSFTEAFIRCCIDKKETAGLCQMVCGASPCSYPIVENARRIPGATTPHRTELLPDRCIWLAPLVRKC